MVTNKIPAKTDMYEMKQWNIKGRRQKKIYIYRFDLDFMTSCKECGKTSFNFIFMMDPGKVMDKIKNEVKKLDNEDEDVFLDQDKE